MIVVLVDNQPLCIDFLSSMIESRFPKASIRLAGDRPSAMAIMDELTPNLVIVEASLPDLSAEADLQALVGKAAPAPVVIMESQPLPARVRRAREAGARGLVARTFTRDLIDASISLIAAGGEYFPPVPAENARAEDAIDDRHGLSPRQAQVLEQIMRGKANREIAANLGISAATVKLHVHAILKAIGARNRTEAALLGRDVLRGPRGG